MATSDATFVQSTGMLMDEHGNACSIRRPHTLKLFSGAAITSLLVKTQAEVNDASLVLEAAGSARITGGLPVGIVLVLAGTSYTVQAAASTVPASKQITVTISPVVDAQALVGAVVTVPSEATWSGTSVLAPRYWENSAGASTFGGLPVGTRIAVIEKGGNGPAALLDGGTHGDYLDDADGNNLGRITQLIDRSAPGTWQAVIQ